jgi:hypothetical protein
MTKNPPAAMGYDKNQHLAKRFDTISGAHAAPTLPDE